MAFVVALLLVVYGSLFPGRGWTNLGVSPLAWIQAPFPRYWTLPEVVWNVLAYMPLGALLAWALWPRWRGAKAVLIGTLGCALVSATMESIQTYLPGRVASNVDFAANSAGAFLGVLLGALSARRLIDVRSEVHWGEHILRKGTYPVVILCALWVLAQIPPQPMLLANGDVAGSLDIAALKLETWWPPAAHLVPETRARIEQACTALAVLGFSLLLLHCLRPFRLRAWLVPLFVALALSAKAAARPLGLPGSPEFFAWLTPAAGQGLILGMLIALALSAVAPLWQRRVAIAALILQLLIVNAAPADRYFLASIASGYTGLLHADELLAELAVLWPFLALGWMLFGRGSRAAARAAPARAAAPEEAPSPPPK
ncbi:VanZ family protein [Verticiella sediminum]|nr:VanZ family protein [Verticiella sediminum]